MSDQEKVKRRFRHWAYLNAEGKKIYGDIFPYGNIPVVSMIPTLCRIEGHPERCYMIYHEELGDGQFRKLVTNIAERFGVSEEVVRKHVSSGKLEDRIPIRDRFIGGSGTNQMGLFV